jgi:hypothetical protein
MTKKRAKKKTEKKITITFQESYNTKLDQIGLCYVQQGRGSKKIAGSFNMGVDEWKLFKEAMETVKHPKVTIVLQEYQCTPPQSKKETVKI